MEDMIKKIVEMDKMARKLTDEAKSRRARSSQYVNKRKEAVRKEYQDMANHRIDVIRQDEQALADERAKASEQKHRENSLRLSELAARNSDAWVEEIVKRTVQI